MMAKIIPSYREALERFQQHHRTVYGAYTTKTETAQRYGDRSGAVWAEVVTDVRKLPAIAGDEAKRTAKAAIEKTTGARVTQVWYDP